MERVVHGFDWDDANVSKCQKHGITIPEIEFLFQNDPLVLYDARHSHAEVRYFAVGKNERGRYIFVSFTHRIKNSAVYIRPFSARYMHKKEITHYEAYENE